MPLWGGRAPSSIGRKDLLDLVEAIRDLGTAGALAKLQSKMPVKFRAAQSQARNVLGYCKTLFAWGAERGGYGFEHSPFSGIRSTRLLGEKASRERVLNDDEIFALLRVTRRMP